MRSTLIAIVLAAVVGIPAPSRAQAVPKCKDSESALACADRLVDVLRGITKPTATGMTAKSVDVGPKTETGLVDLPNGLSSSTKDFLPLLQLTSLLGSVESDDKTGTVSVAFNPPIGAQFRDVQLRALVNSKPQLFQPLKAALDEDTIQALEGEIAKGKNRQDVTLELSANLRGYRSGRNIAAYSTMVDAFFDKAGAAVAQEAMAASTAVMTALRDTVGAADLNTPLDQLAPAVRAKAKALALAFATVQASGADKMAAAMKVNGLLLLPQMVNNQPQLVATFSYAFRDALVGPNAVLAGRVAFEKALGGDLNSFLSSRGGYYNCVGSRNIDGCYADFAEYVARPGVETRVRTGLRLSAFIGFTKLTQDYAPATDAGSLPFMLKASTLWTGGLDFGRLLDVDVDGKVGGRFDASIRYDHHGSSDARDRFVASVTITKKLGDASVPFGLVYANQPAFLSKSDYDHGLSAHLGLKFNLFKGLK